MQKDQILDLILFVQLKLRICMYVNYVKSDFVVFFCQDNNWHSLAVIVIKKTSQEWPLI